MLRTVAKRAVALAYRRNLSMIREPGAVGLDSGDKPLEKLTALYNETLEAVKELPEDASYRVNVEKITKFRMGVVKDHADVEKIEEVLNVGQVQEIIEQAENELDLIPHMAAWKPWEMKEGQEPVVIQVVD